MLETTGVKLIKPSTKNCTYADGQWWYVGTNDGGRRSIEAHNRKNITRMFVDGKYVPKSHPLYKAGRYKTFESAAFSALEGYSKSTVGYVYVVSNPAWEGWFKVGMAVDAYDRCSQYQTSSPYRDYVVEYCKYFEDRKKAESQVHALLKGTEQRGEWFRAELSVIKNTIKTIEGV
jgi:hypothetical protein